MLGSLAERDRHVRARSSPHNQNIFKGVARGPLIWRAIDAFGVFKFEAGRRHLLMRHAVDHDELEARLRRALVKRFDLVVRRPAPEGDEGLEAKEQQEPGDRDNL